MGKSNLVLIGMPGCGKTTFGKKMAVTLGMNFVDVDSYMEETTGKTVAELLTNLGEEKFLEFEKESTLKIQVENTVIATTGSSPLKGEAVKHLSQEGYILYLDVPARTIEERLAKMKVNRIVGMGRMSMAEILAYRQPFYEKLYDFRFSNLISTKKEENYDNLWQYFQSLNLKIPMGSVDKNKIPTTFSSTLNDQVSELFDHAITNAQPVDKGLWFRQELPLITPEEEAEYVELIRAGIASNSENKMRQNVKELFVQLWQKMRINLSEVEIRKAVDCLDSFQSPLIVPLEKINEEQNLYLINEATGPTNAFKDLALQMLTSFVSQVIIKENKETIDSIKQGVKGGNLNFLVTQTSTSGDTGPAGGSGIEDKDFIINVIGYPAGEATFGQAGQMLYLQNNVWAVPMKEAFSAIQESMKEGNTAEYQARLKEVIETELSDLIAKYSLEVNIKAGSFNSVNIGRIDGQTIYHLVAFLIAKAQKIVDDRGVIEVIPSGNFGHCYGALQANQITGGQMKKIIVSTNENEAIYKLINQGEYQKADQEVSCPSVSMIIRYGSNVERLFRLALGVDKTKAIMAKFNQGEKIILSEEEHKKIKELGLLSYKVSTVEELQTMRTVFIKTGRLICPHTANAYRAAIKYKQDHPECTLPVLISETASPWKFLASVAAALTAEGEALEEKYNQLVELEKTQTGVQELLNIIQSAYVDLGKEFTMELIPANLRRIYEDGLPNREVKSAADFQKETVEFLKSYAPKFKEQVERLF